MIIIKKWWSQTITVPTPQEFNEVWMSKHDIANQKKVRHNLKIVRKTLRDGLTMITDQDYYRGVTSETNVALVLFGWRIENGSYYHQCPKLIPLDTETAE